jgi:hypothetical protein
MEEQSQKTFPVVVPEKHFLKWHQEETSIVRSKMRYDFAKESLPYTTALLVLVFTGIFYREALIGLAPTLSTWIIHSLKKHFESGNKPDVK